MITSVFERVPFTKGVAYGCCSVCGIEKSIVVGVVADEFD
jgi:hypothetical protein